MVDIGSLSVPWFFLTSLICFLTFGEHFFNQFPGFAPIPFQALSNVLVLKSSSCLYALKKLYNLFISAFIILALIILTACLFAAFFASFFFFLHFRSLGFQRLNSLLICLTISNKNSKSNEVREGGKGADFNQSQDEIKTTSSINTISRRFSHQD